MASTVSSNKVNSVLAQKAYDFDPDATTLTDIAWVPMNGFHAFMASFVRTIGTSAVVFKIAAATDSAGTGAVVVKDHAVAAAPDAVGDQLYLECTAEELKGLGQTLDHVSAQVSVATGTDEGVVVYTRLADRQYNGLTADAVA
jgi:hypothetical protein